MTNQKNNKLGEVFNEAIRDTVNRVCSERQIPDVELLATDNLGEIVDKLTILNIRCWMLEDAIAVAKTDEDIANYRRKLELCYKVKRPKLVEAINRMVDDAIMHNKSLREDSVKLYWKH